MRHHFLTAAVLSALPFALSACAEKKQADPRTAAPLVRAVTIEGAGPSSRAFTGTVAARVQTELGFRVAGKVVQRFVDAGQSVKRGQLLLRIDAADLKLAAQAQREAVIAARARARQTEDDEARYRSLRGTGAVSAAGYDLAKAAADAAKAQLNAATAQAELAQNASRYTELFADADGVVMETMAEPGQVVSAGQAVLRLARAGSREASVQLPEALRPALGSNAMATLFGKEGQAVPVQLRQLSDTADRLTRTFEARYVLSGELANAPLGATVTVALPDARPMAESGLSIPVGALYDAGKGPGVWVIQGQPAKVSWRPVVVHGMGDEGARIAGQLRQGERIVALGAHLLREGEQVRVAVEDMPMSGARP
jgi:RND family efflux transporter MFP subunit